MPSMGEFTALSEVSRPEQSLISMYCWPVRRGKPSHGLTARAGKLIIREAREGFGYQSRTIQGNFGSKLLEAFQPETTG